MKKNTSLKERIEKSIKVMYEDDDLSLCPLFKGGFINWGYYDQIDLSKKISDEARINASERLYEISSLYLNLKSDDKFLEISPGKGFGLHYLSNKYSLKNVTGLDQNPKYILECKKRVPFGCFITQSVENINLKTKFDKILSVEAIQHFPNVKQFLDKIYGLLKDNGVCVIASFFGTDIESTNLIGDRIQTVKDGIDILHNIEEIKEHLMQLDVDFDIQPIGKNVFPGFDEWTSQTSLKNSWTRNWYKAFREGLINYFIIKISKRKNFSNPIDNLISAYKNGKLEKYNYIRRMHRINKSLHYISRHLKNTDIKKIEISDSGLLFVTKNDNIKLRFNGLDRRGAPFEILNFGSYEEADNYILFRLIQKNDVIFDIGANIGWYSILFSKKFPESKIYSFEPINETFQFLKQNIDLNKCANVEFNNIGISNKNGKTKFFYFPEGSIIASQKNLINCSKAKEISCEVVTLDKFIKNNNIDKIDLIKCDIEGGELFALEGGIKSLKRLKPKIFIELCHDWTKAFGYHPNDIIKTLSSLGYKCFSPENNYLIEITDLTEIPSEEKLNYFFLHESKHKKLIKKLVIELK